MQGLRKSQQIVAVQSESSYLHVQQGVRSMFDARVTARFCSLADVRQMKQQPHFR